MSMVRWEVDGAMGGEWGRAARKQWPKQCPEQRRSTQEATARMDDEVMALAPRLSATCPD